MIEETGIAPHSLRGSFRAQKEARRRFGPPGPIPDGFAAELVERGPHYDPQLAYLLSVISGWSYSDGVTLANQLKYYGFGGATVDEFSVRNPAMYIVATGFFIRSECGRVGILSFRGTEPTNIINWLTDSDLFLHPFGGEGCLRTAWDGWGAVHRGFFVNLQSVWEGIEAELEKAVQPDRSGTREPLRKLYITGHSLGGAMAVLAGAKIFGSGSTEMRDKIHGIYTFGQPAVGDAKFKTRGEAAFGDRLHRHEYHRDAVPRLPPAITGRFDHFGSVRVSPAVTEGWGPPREDVPQARFIAPAVLSVLASFVGRRISYLGRLERGLCKYSLFDDHSPTRYIQVSRAALDPRPHRP